MDPFTSHLYKKKRSSAQEPIFLGESENENNDVIISVLVEGNDWRSDRMEKDDSEELTKVDDPAPEHQRQQWNKNCEES